MKLLLMPIVKLRQLYWWLVKPITIGVRAIVVDKENRVLLVNHSYIDQWFLPGGKVNKGEALRDAIEREVKEEAGIMRIEECRVFHAYSNFFEYKRDYIIVYVINNFEQVNSKHFEIKDCNFFSSSEIPINTSPGTKRRLKEFFDNTAISDSW